MNMLEGKRITVLGGGLSGRSAARLAHRLGASVVLSDLRPDCAPLDGVENIMGEHPDRILDADTVVVSPGIPARAAAVQKALSSGTDVVGELGFAAQFLPPEMPVVAITGTNGKSTVTSFTGQLLEAAGWRTFVGGNLGTPLSEAVGESWDAAVVEVSSYQMELPGDFSPHVSAVLNLTPDHLGRHGTMESYASHKLRTLSLLVEGGVGVLPAQDSLLNTLAESFDCTQLYFDHPSGVVLQDTEALIVGQSVDLSGLDVPGELNRWNAAAACLLAHLAGMSVDKLRPSDLTALPHRMQGLPQTDSRLWINDSKATNVEATMAGVMGLEGRVVLLVGGQGKDGADYRQLQRLFDEGPVSDAIAFGHAAPEIAAALNGHAVHRSEGLEEAVALANSLAGEGSTVVLSPACASFDEFDDFSHRGRVFSDLVTRMETKDVENGRNQ